MHAYTVRVLSHHHWFRPFGPDTTHVKFRPTSIPKLLSAVSLAIFGNGQKRSGNYDDLVVLVCNQLSYDIYHFFIARSPLLGTRP